ncbi:MAG TPA: hypothetical protein VII01_07565 [Solirubrobacteraceae bacterium]
MTNSTTRWAPRFILAAALLICSAMLALSATAGAARPHRGGSQRASRVLPGKLLSASRAAARADRALVADARSLNRCLHRRHSHRGSCRAGHQALQRAGSHLAATERRLARLGRANARIGAHSARLDIRSAPHLTVSAQKLRWTRVAGVASYVFVRKVPGQVAQYSVIRTSAIKPPPVPGVTVRYSLRTTATRSTWAPEVSITYPPVSSPVPVPDRQAAPQIGISGQTLTWNKVAGVGTYVLVSRVAGKPDQFSEVSGTSTKPAAVAGATVHYSVRTAVAGSVWSTEVSIAYAAGSLPPPPATPPPVTPPPAGEGSATSLHMTVALDIGGWTWASAINDEAGAVRYVRSSYKHFNSDSQMELLAKAGITLMPLFGEDGSLSSYDNPAFFNEVVTWFKRYGHGGTFWAGKPLDLGATTAELINEPGNPYFYPDFNNTQLYANMTKSVHGAFEANFAPDVRPKLLVSYDGGFNGSPYGRAIFAAGAVADGVTVHPYGGHGAESALGGHERVIQAHNETGLPVYVTEVGWPTALGQAPTGDSLQWTEQQQADNTTGFINWARGLGYVADVTYFNYADYGTNNWYGVVNASGKTHKLDYYALKAATAAAG